ncbi:MAG: WG repeat-containing protein, partial [Gemmatimonadota bacterium]
GRARVRFGTKWGYIDRAGDVAIPARFDEASDFQDGYASAVLRGQRVWIDRSGRVVDADEVGRARSL